jgi:hypothetical protein
MARYHINLETGEPGLCRATQKCPFGDASEHYASKDEARSAYEIIATAEIQRVTGRASKSRINFDPSRMSMDEIQKFVDSSVLNYSDVDDLIQERAKNTVEMGRKLDMLNPGTNSNSNCDSETFKSLKKEYLEYRDRTADLVDACSNSPLFSPKYQDLTQDESIGDAVRSGTSSANSQDWLSQRFDTVGGSDVGVLVKNDFTSEEDLMFYDRIALDRTINSKLIMSTSKNVETHAKMMEARAGALYRGTIWEDRIRDNFAKQNDEYEVYETKNQFNRIDRDWQKVNFDGILVDKKSGALGILECKTSDRPQDWEEGIPINYRAQTLYYMNAANVDYGVVTVAIRDGELRSYKLHRNDPVVPGAYEGTMEDYINERVSPWFEDLRSQREEK